MALSDLYRTSRVAQQPNLTIPSGERSSQMQPVQPTPTQPTPTVAQQPAKAATGSLTPEQYRGLMQTTGSGDSSYFWGAMGLKGVQPGTGDPREAAYHQAINQYGVGGANYDPARESAATAAMSQGPSELQINQGKMLKAAGYADPYENWQPAALPTMEAPGVNASGGSGVPSTASVMGGGQQAQAYGGGQSAYDDPRYTGGNRANYGAPANPMGPTGSPGGKGGGKSAAGGGQAPAGGYGNFRGGPDTAEPGYRPGPNSGVTGVIPQTGVPITSVGLNGGRKIRKEEGGGGDVGGGGEGGGGVGGGAGNDGIGGTGEGGGEGGNTPVTTAPVTPTTPTTPVTPKTPTLPYVPNWPAQFTYPTGGGGGRGQGGGAQGGKPTLAQLAAAAQEYMNNPANRGQFYGPTQSGYGTQTPFQGGSRYPGYGPQGGPGGSLYPGATPFPPVGGQEPDNYTNLPFRGFDPSWLISQLRSSGGYNPYMAGPMPKGWQSNALNNWASIYGRG